MPKLFAHNARETPPQDVVPLYLAKNDGLASDPQTTRLRTALPEMRVLTPRAVAVRRTAGPQDTTSNTRAASRGHDFHLPQKIGFARQRREQLRWIV